MFGQNLLAESSKMESGHALYQVAKFVISHTGSVVSQCVIVCQLHHCAFEPTVLLFFFSQPLLFVICVESTRQGQEASGKEQTPADRWA